MLLPQLLLLVLLVLEVLLPLLVAVVSLVLLLRLVLQQHPVKGWVGNCSPKIIVCLR